MQTLVLKDINVITCGELCTFVYIIVSKQHHHLCCQPKTTEGSFGFVCGSFCLCPAGIAPGGSEVAKRCPRGRAVNSVPRAVCVRLFSVSGGGFYSFRFNFGFEFCRMFTWLQSQLVRRGTLFGFVNLWFILPLFLFQDPSKCEYLHPSSPLFYLYERQHTIRTAGTWPFPGSDMS